MPSPGQSRPGRVARLQPGHRSSWPSSSRRPAACSRRPTHRRLRARPGRPGSSADPGAGHPAGWTDGRAGRRDPAADRARGGLPVVIGGPEAGDRGRPGAAFDLPEALTPIVYVVPGQLLVEAVARRRGISPDAPAGLGKVTGRADAQPASRCRRWSRSPRRASPAPRPAAPRPPPACAGARGRCSAARASSSCAAPRRPAGGGRRVMAQPRSAVTMPRSARSRLASYSMCRPCSSCGARMSSSASARWSSSSSSACSSWTASSTSTVRWRRPSMVSAALASRLSIWAVSAVEPVAVVAQLLAVAVGRRRPPPRRRKLAGSSATASAGRPAGALPGRASASVYLPCDG